MFTLLQKNSAKYILTQMKSLYTRCNRINGFPSSDMEQSMHNAIFSGRGLLKDQRQIKMRLHVPISLNDSSLITGTIVVYSMKAGLLQEILEQNWYLHDTGRH